MKTTQRTFLDYLGAPHTHFIIPVYQRVYTWSDKQCATLWRDCAHAGEAQSEHFIGTVLYSPDPELTGAQTQAIDIIDGQQRTATISLLIAALADYLEEPTQPSFARGSSSRTVAIPRKLRARRS